MVKKKYEWEDRGDGWLRLLKGGLIGLVSLDKEADGYWEVRLSRFEEDYDEDPNSGILENGGGPSIEAAKSKVEKIFDLVD